MQTSVATITRISPEGHILSYDVSCVKACWSSNALEGEGHVGPNPAKRREVLVQRYSVTY